MVAVQKLWSKQRQQNLHGSDTNISPGSGHVNELRALFFFSAQPRDARIHFHIIGYGGKSFCPVEGLIESGVAVFQGVVKTAVVSRIVTCCTYCSMVVIICYFPIFITAAGKTKINDVRRMM